MTQSFFRKVAGVFGLGSFVRDWDTVRALMDAETDALALISPEGEKVYINEAGRRFFKASSLLQSVLDRVIDDEANRLALAKLEAAVEHRAETSVELVMHPLTGKDDFWEWYQITIKQLSVGTLWRVGDVTSDRALEAVMRKETQDLAEFLDVLPIGLYQINSGGVIRFVNQRFCDWLGYTDTQELKDKKLVDLLAGNVPEFDGFWHGELTFRTQTGTFFKAFVSHAVYDENGETMLRASVVRDVMSRQERKESAKEAELGFSRLFTAAPVGIAFLDKENIITEANASFLQMFFKKREEMIGTRLNECIDGEDWAELQDKMAQVIMGQQSRVNKEVRLKTAQEKLNSGLQEYQIFLKYLKLVLLLVIFFQHHLLRPWILLLLKIRVNTKMFGVSLLSFLVHWQPLIQIVLTMHPKVGLFPLRLICQMFPLHLLLSAWLSNLLPHTLWKHGGFLPERKSSPKLPGDKPFRCFPGFRR